MSQEKNARRIPKFDKRRIYNQCARKKGFITTRDVNKEIHKIKVKEGIKLNYYRCDYYGKYHLTKKYVKTAF